MPDPEVGQALARITASPPFAKSARLQRFLTFITELSADGRRDEIKEYSIALSVFDRDETFDPRTDTIVRVEARRLRQALDAYYQGDGAQDPVVISLPRGGYVPTVSVRKPRRPFGLRWLLASLATVVALTGGWLALAPGVPHRFELHEDELSVFDDSDRLCWKTRLDGLAADYQQLPGDHISIADADGDGSPEVLVNFLPEKRVETPSELICYDRRGAVRWRYRYGRPMTFGDRSFDGTYVGRAIRTVRVEGGPRVLVVANHYLWYPSQTALLDGRTGGLVDEYWHPGAVYEVFVRDTDGDGRQEVIFGAINNPGMGLGHAAVGILRLPLGGGQGLKYALLPHPDISRVSGILPILVHMAVTDQGRIVVQTPTPDGGIVFQLDYGLNMVDHRPSDDFAATHERLFKLGLLDHALREGELAALGRAAQFSIAPDGNSPEVRKFWPF